MACRSLRYLTVPNIYIKEIPPGTVPYRYLIYIFFSVRDARCATLAGLYYFILYTRPCLTRALHGRSPIYNIYVSIVRRKVYGVVGLERGTGPQACTHYVAMVVEPPAWQGGSLSPKPVGRVNVPLQTTE